MTDTPSGGLSRRGFLRGSLVASAGAALPGTAEAQEGEGVDTPKRTPESTSVRCVVNGGAQTLGAGVDTTVLSALRTQLGLTGTKLGCGHGACGSCTVLVDGQPQVSCLLPCTALEGAAVTTVEGLASGPKDTDLHPVQRAFAAEDGLQCGFCTPGFVVEAAAFVDQWRAANGLRRPAREVVADALSGHLCRCGAYEHIFSAVQAACLGRYDAPGVHAQRVDALEKVTGRALYTVDVTLPGMLVGKVLRSQVAHGVVQRLQVDEALALPGVRAVLPLLKLNHKVRYAGQAIAAVAAVDEATADRALAAIQLAIKPLEHVLDMAEALRPDAPVLYPKGERRDASSAAEMPMGRSGWDENLRGPTAAHLFAGPQKARRIIEERAARERPTSPSFLRRTTETHTQQHTALEPHAAVARWAPDGSLELWTSTQSVGDVAEDLAALYRLRPNRVTVHAPFVGGGFGAKAGLQLEQLLAVRLSAEARAPVRLVYSREEEMIDGGVRPAQQVTLSLAVDGQGSLEAMGVETYGDSGVAVGSSVGFLARLLYPAAHKHLIDHDVVTNTSPGKPFRGPGGPAAFFALETGIDELARRRERDPVAQRRRWDPNPARQRLYRWVETVPLWRDRSDRRTASGRFRRGVGLAAAGWPAFVDPHTRVELSAGPNGLVARTTTQDIGTGSRSVIAHAVARVLDLPPHRVEVVIGQTGTVHGPMSAASKTTASVGPAAIDAAETLAAELVNVVNLDFGLGLVTRVSGGVKHAGGFLTWSQVFARIKTLTVVGKRPRDDGGYFLPITAQDINITKELPGAVQVVAVTVDTELGRVSIDEVDVGISVGRIYVPKLAENQVQGGVLQGISYALYEQRVLDGPTGRLLTTGLEDYRIAGMADSAPIRVTFDEEGFERVPGGGVGLGEICTVAVPAAIANAVHHATGWRPRALPLSPRRVRAGLHRGKA